MGRHSLTLRRPLPGSFRRQRSNLDLEDLSEIKRDILTPCWYLSREDSYTMNQDHSKEHFTPIMRVQYSSSCTQIQLCKGLPRNTGSVVVQIWQGSDPWEDYTGALCMDLKMTP